MSCRLFGVKPLPNINDNCDDDQEEDSDNNDNN